MLENLRKRLFVNALKKMLAAQKRMRKPNHPEHAVTLGILFNATDDKQRREVEDYANGLEKKGKKITLLGYFNTKNPPEKPPFDAFSLKDLQFSRQPKEGTAKAFVQSNFDLLICFNPDQVYPIEWIAAASQAGMKVGLPTVLPNDYDFVLEPSGSGDKHIQTFVTQIQPYLDRIVLPNHASTRKI